MVQWISPIPIQLDHSVVRQKLEPNISRSGEWLIDDQFVPWMRSRNLTKPVFWLRGGSKLSSARIKNSY